MADEDLRGRQRVLARELGNTSAGDVHECERPQKQLRTVWMALDEDVRRRLWVVHASRAAVVEQGLKMPKEVRPFLLVPLNELQDEHYTVYFCKPEAEAQAARPPRFCV